MDGIVTTRNLLALLLLVVLVLFSHVSRLNSRGLVTDHDSNTDEISSKEYYSEENKR